MVTNIKLSEKKLNAERASQLDTWETMVSNTPNLRTVSNYPVWDFAYNRSPTQAKGTLVSDSRSPESWTLLVPCARDLSAMSHGVGTISPLRPPRLAPSYVLKARCPKDQEEAAKWAISLKSPLPSIHAIETGPIGCSFEAFTNQDLDEFLSNVAKNQESFGAESQTRLQSIDVGLTCTSENKSIKSYADSAATLKTLWRVGCGGVRALSFRSYKPDRSWKPDLRPTDQSFFESPQFAAGVEVLQIEVSKAEIPKSTKIPASMRKLTLAYRHDDLPEGDYIDQLANCVGTADISGSLVLRVECSEPIFVKSMVEQNRALEEHRLRREKEYNRKLQDGSLLPPIEEAACVELPDDSYEMGAGPSAVSQSRPQEGAVGVTRRNKVKESLKKYVRR
jgi:hypothetical protein